MDIEVFRTYCLSLNGAEETTPFGPDNLVYKVGGKIFSILSLDSEEATSNLKCEPERAIQLRESYPDHIIPGYHMNKKHWNTVYLERGLTDQLVRELADHSYSLVFKSLSKAVQIQISPDA